MVHLFRVPIHFNAMVRFLYVLPCLFETVGALAPIVVVPPAASRSRPVTGPAGALPGHVAGATDKAAPRLRGGTQVLPQLPVQSDIQSSEKKLMDALRTRSASTASMYYEADALRLNMLADGSPSVAALLEVLAARPPPERFEKAGLSGDYQLEYTNSLPLAIREEIARHVNNDVIDLSVTMSISDSGAVNTKAAITLLGGAEKVVSLRNFMSQEGLSPRFLVNAQGGARTALEVTYFSDCLLVLQSAIEDDKLGRLFQSNGVPETPPIKTEVWSKCEIPETRPTGSPTSFWRFGLQDAGQRFGLPFEILRQNQIEAGMTQPSENLAAPMGGWASFGTLGLAALAITMAANTWWRWATSPKDIVTMEMATWPRQAKFSVLALGGESTNSTAHSTHSARGSISDVKPSKPVDIANEVEAKESSGFWDPLGLSTEDDLNAFKRRREVELKHSRIAMVAAIGYIAPEYYRFAGSLSPSQNVNFEDIPNGLAAIGKVPGLGWVQIIFFIGLLESAFSNNETRAPSSHSWMFGHGKAPEQQIKRQTVELYNGRIAMVAIACMFVHDFQTLGYFPSDLIDAANAAPLRAFKYEVGAQSTFNMWDVANLSVDDSIQAYKRVRTANGRVAMLAAISYLSQDEPSVSKPLSGNLQLADFPCGWSPECVRAAAYSAYCAHLVPWGIPSGSGFGPGISALEDAGRKMSRIASGRLAILAFAGLSFKTGLGDTLANMTPYADGLL